MENVNHPKHYNSHPNGIECIDIIHHYVCDIANAIKYLWRAGLKVPSKQVQCDACIDIAEREEARPTGQMGMEDAEKEIEDLKKALWYIEDYRIHYIIDETSIMSHCITMTLQKWADVDSYELPKSLTDHWIKEQTGHTVEEIIQPYEQHVAYAIGCLLHIGLICDHHELTPDDYIVWLDEATDAIQHRIAYIKNNINE